MTNQDLYKQAILDARAVRDTAMAAAKETLAEAFEPRIKEALRLKLAENDMEESSEMDEDEMEEGLNVAASNKADGYKRDFKGTVHEESDMEEATLDEILAELDAMDEAKDKKTRLGSGVKAADKEINYKAAKSSIKEAEEDGDDEEMEMDDEEAPEMDGEEAPDDEQVVDITVGELKDIFRDVFAQLQGGAPEEAPEAGEEAGEEEEISLDEILAELEDESSMEENLNPGAEVVHKRVPTKYAHGEIQVDEAKKLKKDLEAAKKAIEEMRSQLQETNLLNAKLLYVNKLWKGKSLTESQKVKVLSAFDRATTVREAENIYKTLNESLTVAKKSTIKESFGYASKPIGTAQSKPIVEVDAMVTRWKTLAGIK